MSDKIYDLAILGAGPAGLSAAVDAENNRLNFIIFEHKDPLWFSKAVVNQHINVDGYLGFGNTTGSMLAEKMLEHTASKNITVTKAHIESISFTGTLFEIKNNLGTFFSKTALIATGIRPISIEVPGIEKFFGKQIFNFVDIDAYKFKDKKIVVMGGRNSGVTAALYIKRNISDNVLLLERADRLKATMKYQEQLHALGIKYATNSNVVEFVGNKKLESIYVNCLGKIENISTDAVVVCIGMKPNLEIVKNLEISYDKCGEIIVNAATMETSIPGLYAAGDIVNLKPKQITNACAHGKTAIYHIFQWLTFSR